jgi:DnaJ-class molecular chaperone
MPADDEDDGPPTVPDVNLMKCPECNGVGYLDGDRIGRFNCATCWGRKYITHEAHVRWKQRQGRD